jgi:hypothetical protein
VTPGLEYELGIVVPTVAVVSSGFEPELVACGNTVGVDTQLWRPGMEHMAGSDIAVESLAH